MPNQPAKTRFIVLNSPRVGSNMLCTTLDSHPEVMCHQEIFNPNMLGYARSLKGSDFSLGTVADRDQNPLKTLDNVWEHSGGFPCVGFKMCWRQNETVLQSVLADSSIKKLVLKRRNTLKSFVSLLRARKTSQWVVYASDKATLSEEKVHVNPDEFKEFLDINQGFYSQIADSLKSEGQEGLQLYFEDLFKLEERKRLLRFLGVSEKEAGDMQAATVQINKHGLEKVVTNYDVVQAIAEAYQVDAH